MRGASRPFDTRRRARFRRRAQAILIWAVTGWLLFAFASSARGEPGDEPAQRTLRLRCWQEGRLIFEHEKLAAGSLETPGDVRLRAESRDGDHLRLLEVGQATCLTEVGELD